MLETDNTASTPSDEATAKVLQDTPTPEAIKQHMEGQARIIQAGATLGYLAHEAQGFIGMLTSNNPRVALAIANELVLCYDESMRRGLQIVQQSPAAKLGNDPAGDAGAVSDVSEPSSAPETPAEPGVV